MKIEQVAAEEIAVPASQRTARKYRDVYDQAARLDVGQALRMTFDTEKEMAAAYSAFRVVLMTERNRATRKVYPRRGTGLAGKRWDVFKHTAALSVAIIRLPDVTPDDAV